MSSLADFLAARGASWALELGVDCGGVRGCRAARDLDPGDAAISVPYDALIAARDEAALRDALLAALAGPDPRWAPYLRSLPALGDDDLDSVPLLWSDERLAELRLPALEARVRAQREALRRECQDQGRDWAAFARAALLVQTRAFWIADGPRGRQIALVPGVDLINHRDGGPGAPELLAAWEPDAERFVLRAGPRAGFRQGHEVTKVYRSACPNAELLLLYGFCAPDNPHDVVDLDVAPLAADHPRTFDACGGRLAGRLFPGRFCSSLVALFRMLDLAAQEGAAAAPAARHGPLDWGSERRALQRALDLVSFRLEDGDLDPGGAPPGWRRNVLLLRQGQQRILRHQARLLECFLGMCPPADAAGLAPPDDTPRVVRYVSQLQQLPPPEE